MAKKYSISDVMTMTSYPNSYDDLVSMYRTAAKAADQRLVRLERAASEPEYKNVKQFAYARAQKDIQRWSGKNATRFNTKPPAREIELREKLQDIRTFLKAPTSSKSGIKKTYQKAANTMNKRYGTNFKWDDLSTFFESQFYKKVERDYDSKQVVEVIGKMQKDPKAYLDKIKHSRSRDIKTEDSDTVMQRIENDLINEYGNALAKYLKKL